MYYIYIPLLLSGLVISTTLGTFREEKRSDCAAAKHALEVAVSVIRTTNAAIVQMNQNNNISEIIEDKVPILDVVVDVRPIQRLIEVSCVDTTKYLHTSLNSVTLDFSSENRTSRTYNTANNDEPSNHQADNEENKFVACSLAFILQGLCIPKPGKEFSIFFVGSVLNVSATNFTNIDLLEVSAKEIRVIGFNDSQLLKEIIARPSWESVTKLTVQASQTINLDFAQLKNFPQLEEATFQNVNINCTSDSLTDTLKILELNRIEPKNIKCDKLFSKLPSLKVLIWQNSNMTKLPNPTFSDATSIKTLRIVNTGLSTIEPNSFDDMTKLEELEILESKLEGLPKNILENQKQLEHLRIARNKLTSLNNAFFHGLSNLELLDLGSNHITQIDEGTFKPLISLRHLELNRNQLTKLSSSLEFFGKDEPGGTHSNLTRLNLRSNEELSIHKDTFQHFPNIQEIILSDCYLSELPYLMFLKNLTTIKFNNHKIKSISLSETIPLNLLKDLEMSKYGNPPIQVWMGSNTTYLSLLQLNRVEILNANVTEVLDFFVNSRKYTNDLSIKLLRIGWPEMDKNTFPIEKICQVLHSNVDLLEITNSGYKFLELCSNNTMNRVILHHNPKLQRVIIPWIIVELNVSHCTNLTELSVPRVDILDMSDTSLPLSQSLCTTWGIDTLIARKIQEPKGYSREIIPAVFRQCVETANIIDVSENRWLRFLVWVDQLNRLIALSDEPVRDALNNAAVASRSDFPLMQIENTPISCDLLFQTRTGIQDNKHVPTRFMHYSCQCSPGFYLSDDKCIPSTTDLTGPVVGAVFGTLFVVGAFLLLSWKVLRYKKRGHVLQNERDLSERLLEVHKEEVIALKRVWEIDSSELQIERRLAAGAFGIIFKAMWETIHVAVKFLQMDVAMLDDSAVHEFEREVDFLQRTRHPCVVRFFGAGTDSLGKRFLVLEYVALGSLEKLLRSDLKQILLNHQHEKSIQDKARGQNKIIPAVDETIDGFLVDTMREGRTQLRSITSVWQLKLCLLHDVADGMAFIHSLGHVHRDLKSANVLVTSTLRGKITDFGSIKQCLTKTQGTLHSMSTIENNTDVSYSSEKGSATMGLTATCCVGTPLYMAPEALEGRPSFSKADVFSFGVLLWEVATQQRPDIISQEKGDSFRGPMFYTLQVLLQSQSEHR